MSDDLIADALNDTGIPGYRCRVGTLLNTLDKADPQLATQIRDALDHPQVQTAALARALTRRGYEVPQQTLARHRRGVCRCDR